MSNVYYIELSGQGERLLIAIPIGDMEYHMPWDLVKVKYGMDVIANIRDSKFFTKHPISELPKDITEDFDWRRQYHEYAVCFYKEIVQNKKATEKEFDELEIFRGVLIKLHTARWVGKTDRVKEILDKIGDYSYSLTNRIGDEEQERRQTENALEALRDL